MGALNHDDVERVYRMIESIELRLHHTMSPALREEMVKLLLAGLWPAQGTGGAVRVKGGGLGRRPDREGSERGGDETPGGVD